MTERWSTGGFVVNSDSMGCPTAKKAVQRFYHLPGEKGVGKPIDLPSLHWAGWPYRRCPRFAIPMMLLRYGRYRSWPEDQLPVCRKMSISATTVCRPLSTSRTSSTQPVRSAGGPTNETTGHFHVFFLVFPALLRPHNARHFTLSTRPKKSSHWIAGRPVYRRARAAPLLHLLCRFFTKALAVRRMGHETFGGEPRGRV